MRAQRITAPVGLVVALLLPVALLRPPALADGDGDGQDLAQASQNPVGDIISLRHAGAERVVGRWLGQCK